jgi:hypothetical protein
MVQASGTDLTIICNVWFPTSLGGRLAKFQVQSLSEVYVRTNTHDPFYGD